MKTKTIWALILVLVVGFIAGFVFNQNFGSQLAAVVSVYEQDGGVLSTGNSDCNDNFVMGNAGWNNLMTTVAPGQSKVVHWDFTQCWFGLQNFTAYVTQPRSKNGRQQSLSQNSGIVVTAVNKTTGQKFGPAYILPMGYADHSIIELTIVNNGNKTVDTQITFTGAFGGSPIR